MLDAFEIVTTSGVVLWSRSYAPVGSHIVNSLISEVFIEEKVMPTDGASTAFKKEKYTLKWRRAKDLGLIFVVCVNTIWVSLCSPDGRLIVNNCFRPYTSRSFISAGWTSYWTILRSYSWIYTRTNSKARGRGYMNIHSINISTNKFENWRIPLALLLTSIPAQTTI